jgi:molybdate transport system substrate-binding protein
MLERVWSRCAWVIAALLLVTMRASAQETPVQVVATIALQGAIEELSPLLKAQAGVPIAIEFATTAALVERLANGGRADVAILTREALDGLTASGAVQPPTDLIRSLIGVAVADDAVPPVLRTTEDFIAFLEATPSLAYTLRGVSGVHMAQLIERLGLAAVVRPKATIVDGFSGTLLREGKVAAAVQQIGELKFTGARNVVPLPEALQEPTVFSVSIATAPQHARAAAALVRALTSRDAAAAYARSGAIPLFD